MYLDLIDQEKVPGPSAPPHPTPNWTTVDSTEVEQVATEAPHVLLLYFVFLGETSLFNYRRIPCKKLATQR